MIAEQLLPFCVRRTQTLLEVMRCIDRNAKGIALVVEGDDRLLYTITDGDLRRAVLHGLSLEVTVEAWARARGEHGNLHPKTAPVGTSTAALKRMMEPAGLLHIPLVDERGRLAGLALWSDLAAGAEEPLAAVVMAGGRGERLAPLTTDTPKPMLPIGDRPLMEHIVEQLKGGGIQRVSVTTHYRGDRIVDHFGDGSRFGLQIDYVHEKEPLGTAGGLKLLAPWTTPLLVVNGDVLTRVNYQSMLAFHRETRATMTVGVRQYAVPVPFGVVETDGVEIRGIAEKPSLQVFTNAGVYLLDPEVREYVRDGRFDMPDLITALIAANRRVVSFPISEYWLDVGRHDDYRRAQVDVTNGRC